MLTIGVLKEPEFETRVSLVPEVVASLIKNKVSVIIEKGAGEKASYQDEEFEKAGATISSREQLTSNADLITAINPPEDLDLTNFKGCLIGTFDPLYKPLLIKKWATNNLTIFSLDMLPRTTRAQSMDVLSSQANIAGYKAVLVAANQYPRYFPMFMTAAGSVKPAKVLILGAGVAGLQAIATAKRLGAVVEVFDTRPSVKEEVMSLGAKFVEVEGAADASKAGGYAVEQTEEFKQKQREKIAEHVAKADIVITTAQIRGKKAPVLITEQMITQMKPGSVIVDLAAATGGNTEMTINQETVIQNRVTIIGNSALASSMPADASKLYSKNMFNFLKLIIDPEGDLKLNFEDELVKESCLAHNQQLTNEQISNLCETTQTQ